MDYVLVFFAAMATDWLWATYIAQTAAKNAIKAALWSGVLMLVGAYVTLSYLEDWRMLIPAVIGGMIGTYISVKK